MYGFWYDYIKQKRKLYCKLSFIVYIKTNDTYKDIAEDVNTKFDTQSKVIRLMKNWIN